MHDALLDIIQQDPQSQRFEHTDTTEDFHVPEINVMPVVPQSSLYSVKGTTATLSPVLDSTDQPVVVYENSVIVAS